MDGVIADFANRSLERMGIDPDICTDRSSHSIETWPGVECSKGAFWKAIEGWDALGFWSNLPKFEWSDALVRMCNRYGDVSLATSPSTHPDSWSGKMHWIGKHYPQFIRKTMMGPQKYLMANENTILIDDNDDNIAEFRKHGGIGITFPQPWNTSSVHRSGHVQYVEERLDVLLKIR